MNAKTEQWKEVIEQWRNSGQIQKEFCTEHGLKLSTFQYWMKQIKELQSNNAPVHDLVRIPPSISTPSGNTIVIEIDSHYRLTIPIAVTSDTLRTILAAFR